ncbi:hypothetical protein BaRGS_00036559 [Batillaria attramentaria]|uniref:Uncharacterized protein n=1 Tax=Batillaria attramentaria TaxID=370345 RepID=A0ABD0JCR3_9CAEN
MYVSTYLLQIRTDLCVYIGPQNTRVGYLRFRLQTAVHAFFARPAKLFLCRKSRRSSAYVWTVACHGCTLERRDAFLHRRNTVVHDQDSTATPCNRLCEETRRMLR